MLERLGHMLLSFNPRKVKHCPMESMPLTCMSIYDAAKLTWWTFYRQERRKLQRERRWMLLSAFLHYIPGTKLAFLHPYGIIFQIKISMKHVVSILLHNLQFQVVLRWIEL
jgi:hypothetical protein